MMAKLELTADDTLHVDQADPQLDDRFIPVRVRYLVETVAKDCRQFGGDDPDPMRALADIMADIIDQEATAFERKLADLYAPYNPDRDTIPAPHEQAATNDADQRRRLSRRLEYLLDKANFQKLSDVQIQDAIRAANTYGLTVRLNPEAVEEMSLWVRGRTGVELHRRTLRHPLKGVVRKLSVYRRLAVVARLKDDPFLSLKLFKDIPITDLEALLPHAEVRMNWFDRLRVVGGGVGVVGSTAIKILKVGTAVAAFGQVIWVLLAGAILLCFRAVMGYRSARTRRDSQRTHHLYYKNLANNDGAIHSLLSMIVQEEVKEAFLAYMMCHAAHKSKGSDRSPITNDQALGNAVESYIQKQFGCRIDFDTDDALESITRLGLWNDRAKYRVMDIAPAIKHLQECWCERRSWDYHEQMVKRRQTADANS